MDTAVSWGRIIAWSVAALLWIAVAVPITIIGLGFIGLQISLLTSIQFETVMVWYALLFPVAVSVGIMMRLKRVNQR